MANCTKGKVRKVYYQTDDNDNAVFDFVITIKRPNGAMHFPSVNMVNEGGGFYSFSYTPTMSGLWIEKITSVSHGDYSIQAVEIENYDLDDIHEQISKIKANNNRFLN